MSGHHHPGRVEPVGRYWRTEAPDHTPISAEHVTVVPSGPGCRTLPPEVERLLLEVVVDGFTVYCCGPRTAPTALVASYDWEDCVDQLTIWSWDRVAAARLPKLGRVDVFAPEVVVWTYEGSAEHTVRALLNLVHPQHPDAPTDVYPAPPSLHVPRHHQRPMSIRLPSVTRAGARATRLEGSLSQLTQ